jgi:hypothetical protein
MSSLPEFVYHALQIASASDDIRSMIASDWTSDQTWWFIRPHLQRAIAELKGKVAVYKKLMAEVTQLKNLEPPALD